jgi:amino acid adenylation domain-containing protein
MADIENLYSKILSLAPEKRRLFVKLLKSQGVDISQLPIAHRDPADAVLPLSFAQERLWFLDQLEPNSPVYNIPMGLHLKGALNLSVVQRCLAEIIQRHETLRTRFEAVEGRPVQVIQPADSFEMPLLDLSGLPEPGREIEAIRLCVEETRLPFDLTRDLMLRCKLIRLGKEEHILFLNMHHIASDGWSVGLLIRELKILYQAFCDGKPSPLSELPIQYADFAVWQREWLQGEILDKQLNYWKKQLEGAPALLELPTDRPRPARQSYRGALLSCEMSGSLLPALVELSRREGASLFMTLLAAFQTLLHRYSGIDDVVVGSAIAGRNRAEMENLIGFFVNTLVLRGDLSGNPTFRTLLGRTREVALGAYAHQDLPFEKLVEVLQPARDLSHSPLFQVMLMLQNVPGEKLQLAGLEATPVLTDGKISKFDLTLSLNEHEGSLRIIVEYNTDLFEEETIRRMLGQYQTLLEGIVANPDRRLSELPLLTSAEREQLLVEWNRTEAAYPKDRCLHELIEEQAGRTPDATAVIFEDKRLTYRQLDERANQLAHHLQKLGVGPDTLVGVCVDRSLEMVIGLLGILKAGGAYLPMDPSYPQERLAFMIEDAQPKVLLTQRRWMKSLAAHHAQVVQLDADWPAIIGLSNTKVHSDATSENLAYVIYTSGSTGKPKGVQITQRAVVNFLQSMRQEPGLEADDTLLAITTLSFDIAGLELWLPLTTGARVVLAGRQTAQDGALLAELLERCEATVMQATPSTWRMLLSSGWKGRAGLKILCGGEPWSSELARQLLERCSCLYNMYGPTETTIWSAASLIQAGQPVLIGHPIANTRFYVLDSGMQPVPLGIPGELWIGGDGLARGYLNRAELTAERFSPDPFNKIPGARLYRTGDLVRMRLGGQIEFLGRMDNQVKVRGFRIELGEIETVLAAHPGVRESVVVAREDTPGDKRLVAYVTAKNGEPLNVSELRDLLNAKLPEYMMPSAFVIPDRFPLTPNGKVDRKALPAPEMGKIEIKQSYVAPSTYTEQVLCHIWREWLNLERVGTQDNFFDLGGHSLMAVRIIGEINRTLKVHLHVPAFFQNPTVERLARDLEQKNHIRPEPQLVPLQPGRSPGSLFLLEAGMGLGLCRLVELFDTGPAAFATVVPLPSAACRAASLDKRADMPSLEELAAPHTALIRSHHSDPCWLVGHCFGGFLAFEVAHQLQREGRQVEMIFLMDTWAGIPPWWRRLKVLTFHRAGESLKLRANRLWKEMLARPARVAGRPHRTSQPPIITAESHNPLDPEIVAKVFRNAQNNYRLRPVESQAAVFRPQGSSLSHLYAIDSTLGWKGLFNGGLEAVECPGDHLTMLKAPHLQFLVQQLQKRLEQLHPASRA